MQTSTQLSIRYKSLFLRYVVFWLESRMAGGVFKRFPQSRLSIVDLWLLAWMDLAGLFWFANGPPNKVPDWRPNRRKNRGTNAVVLGDWDASDALPTEVRYLCCFLVGVCSLFLWAET